MVLDEEADVVRAAVEVQWVQILYPQRSAECVCAQAKRATSAVLLKLN